MKSNVALKGMKVARTPEKRREFAAAYKEAKVIETIQGCQRCSAASNMTTPLAPVGSTASEVKFVTHRPGGWERKRSMAMAGRDGSLFRQQSEKAGWGEGIAAIVHQVCCFSDDPDERAESVIACKGNYERQLGDSWLVCLIGGDAFRYHFPKKAFSQNVGKFIWHEERLWFTVNDLGYYMNHPEMLTSMLIQMRQVYEGKTLPIKNPKVFTVSNRNIANKMKNNGGWVHIWSNMIEEPMIVAKDDYTSIPPQHQDLPVYTLSEIVRLKGVGKQGWKAINLVKKEIGGTVYR